MPFHHPAFALLFALTYVSYWLLPARLQHLVLLVSSLAFYYYAGIYDAVLLLVTVALNHGLAARVAGAAGASRSRWTALAVVVNLAVLAHAKYRGFAAENLNALWPALELPVHRDGIPLGISFYVFQLIAYQVDLSRRQIEREPQLWRLLLYILFFPHHQAGPIMRPAAFLPQFYGEKRFDRALAAAGGWWLLAGLVKKVLADRMAPVADEAFALALEGPVASWQAWRAALAFGFQIYGDFSGYSDIAIGLGLLLGYRLDLNFAQPYLAANPSDFWRRWHITLSAWLRDYLYIPLGGNRLGPLRTYGNLFATMVLGGLWHGASWMFILWGALHGALLALHRAVPRLFAPAPVGLALTFVVTTVAWVPFRAESLTQTGRIVGAMFGFGRGPGDSLERWLPQLAFAAGLFGAYALERVLHARADRLAQLFDRAPTPLRGAFLATAIAAIVLTLSSQSTYVYFRF